MILGTHFQGWNRILVYSRRGLSLGGHLEVLAERVPFLLMFGGNLCSKGALGNGSKQVILRWSEKGHFGVLPLMYSRRV